VRFLELLNKWGGDWEGCPIVGLGIGVPPHYLASLDGSPIGNLQQTVYSSAIIIGEIIVAEFFFSLIVKIGF